LRASRARKKNILLRVLSKLRRQPFVVRHSVRIILVRGLKKRARVSRSLSPHGSSNLSPLNHLFILRCGPKDHDLLVSKRRHRIDRRRPSQSDLFRQPRHHGSRAARLRAGFDRA